MRIQDELKEYLISQGVSDVGFCKIDDGDFGECKYGISIVVRLSESIVDEIAYIVMEKPYYQSIISDTAAQFFYGNISAQEAARQMANKVDLYLKEQR